MSTHQNTESLVEPSSQRRFPLTLRTVSLILVLIGVLVSGYISYSELTDATLVCADTGALNCDLVQASAYSKMLGIPIAYLGFGVYLLLGALLLLEDRIPFLQDYGIILVFGITLFSFMFSMWLIYVQASLLQSFCQWCLIHETTMTLLFIISCLRLKRLLSQ